MKKLVLAVIAISIALICISIIYLTWGRNQGSNERTVISSPANNTIVLTDLQKSMAISIALNNTYLHQQMGNMFGYSFVTNNSTHIKDVVASSYRDASPWGNNATLILPAVIITVGNESEAGVNVYAYVDLNKSRVAYIGYTSRTGYSTGAFQISDDGNGVQITSNPGTGWPTKSYLDNLTIVDTGVDEYTNRTEMNDNVVAIVLNNSTLKESFTGYMYHVDDVITPYYDVYNPEYKGRYAVTYPVVVIESYKNLTSTVYYYVVGVNLLNNHTIVHNLGTNRPFAGDISFMTYPE